jgi:hypothetical protein
MFDASIFKGKESSQMRIRKVQGSEFQMGNSLRQFRREHHNSKVAPLSFQRKRLDLEDIADGLERESKRACTTR